MVFADPEPDVDVVVASSTHAIYVVLDTPLEVATPKRLDKVVGWCDGLAAVTPCADAIWGGLGGTPPRFGLGGGSPPDPWWMMDPNGPSGECIDLAKLMRNMCRLLGLGAGEIGYVYGSTDADCYSTSPSAFEARNCPGGVHGAEEIAFYAGGWNNWEAVFRISDWYYAPKVAKSQTPLEILRTILGANAPGPYHTGTHQAWVAAGGGTTCCQNPGPHPVPLPPN
jgi:hypothetical protein